MTQKQNLAVGSEPTQSNLDTLLKSLSKEANDSFLPLANNPERFIDFIYFLRLQPQNTARNEKLAKKFGITERQVRFYASAGEELFGLFYSPERGSLSLTALGKHLSFSRKEDVEQFIFTEMKKVPLVQAFLHKDVSGAKDKIIKEINKNDQWVEQYSPVSIARRADTIRSWVEHIQKSGKPISEREIIQFVKENAAMLSLLFSRTTA